MRILSEYNKVTGCLEVVSHSLDRYGYPRVKRRGVGHSAHRVVWMEMHGDIPPSTYVCHSCDNRRCINTDHLFLGTMYDNINDMIAKRRHTHGERNGCHKLSDSDVITIYNSELSKSELSDRYCVSERQIYYIKQKRRWNILLNAL
jgi:hypothetical protein